MAGDSRPPHHGHTVHGGSMFSSAEFGPELSPRARFESPALSPFSAPLTGLDSPALPSSCVPLDAVPRGGLDNSQGHSSSDESDDPLIGDPDRWTVHDGKHFAHLAQLEATGSLAQAYEAGRSTIAHGSFSARQRRRLNAAGLRASGIKSKRAMVKNAERAAAFLAEVDAGSVHGGRSGKGRVEVKPPRPLAALGATLQINDFLTRACVGMGMFSSVHAAKRVSDNFNVAIKIWHRPICATAPGKGGAPSAAASGAAADPADMLMYDTQDISAFTQEVSLLSDANMRHAHIVPYIGHGFIESSDGVAGFIVLALIDGSDLRRVLRQPGEKPGLREVERWAAQIASVLQHLHALSIVHRDIKETNVMIKPASASAERSFPAGRPLGSDAWGDAVVIDFGLSVRLLPTGLGPVGAKDTTLFQASQQCGVFGYMAPEVYNRKPYGTAVDVFAFGQVLRRMLSMIAPPPSDCRPRYAAAYALSSMCAGCAPAWAYQTLHCSPFAVARAWPAYLSALALACCSVDPDDRPKSSALAASLAAKTGTQEADA